MSNEKRFSAQTLKDLDFPYCDEVVDTKYFDSGRWYEHWLAVYKDDDGKFYQIDYFLPATEMQEIDLFYDEDTVTGVEVELKAVVTEKWLPVP